MYSTIVCFTRLSISCLEYNALTQGFMSLCELPLTLSLQQTDNN